METAQSSKTPVTIYKNAKVASQRTAIFSITTVRTSNLANTDLFLGGGSAAAASQCEDYSQKWHPIPGV
jgi:hypothetical protein